LAAAPASRGDAVRNYEPLHEFPALFRTFADTEPSPDGALEFADRYGALTRRTAAGRGKVLGRAAGRRPAAWRHRILDDHETFPYWLEQILAMRRAVGLWDLVRKNDGGRLAPHFFWKRDAAGVRLVYDSHPDLAPGRPAEAPEVRSVETIAERG